MNILLPFLAPSQLSQAEDLTKLPEELCQAAEGAAWAAASAAALAPKVAMRVLEAQGEAVHGGFHRGYPKMDGV